MKPGKRPIPIEDRFWAMVKKTNGCWEWMGQRLPRGYGMIKQNEPRKNIYTHRLSWEIHHGAIPEGKSVLHHCDNPGCVNPAHLFVGSDKDNMADCARKGRIRGCTKINWRGERSPKAKLTDDAVRDILTGRQSLAALANKYGVTKGTIWKVRNGLTWGVR